MGRKLLQLILIMIVVTWTVEWARYYALMTEHEFGFSGLKAYVWTYGPLLILLFRLWSNQKEASEQTSNLRQERLAELEQLMKTNIQAVIGSDGATCTIRSFDGGQNWYVSEENPEDGVISLNPVETANPVLLGQVPLFMALSNKAIAFNLSGRNPSELADLLMQHKKDHLTICGCSDEIESFQLKTFDGGKNWFAVRSNDKALHILGRAEEVYPDLLKSIFTLEDEDRDELADAFEEHGCFYIDLKS